MSRYGLLTSYSMEKSMDRKKGCCSIDAPLAAVVVEEEEEEREGEEVCIPPRRVSIFSHRMDCRRWRQSALTSAGRSPQLHFMLSMLAGRERECDGM